jgi:hypothetical protein
VGLVIEIEWAFRVHFVAFCYSHLLRDIRFQQREKMTEPTYDELKARLAELEKQTAGRQARSLEFRVSEKGGVSVYGLGRFPVTLYYEQWTRLLDLADSLRAFLEENKAKLKLKEPK